MENDKENKAHTSITNSSSSNDKQNMKQASHNDTNLASLSAWLKSQNFNTLTHLVVDQRLGVKGTTLLARFLPHATALNTLDLSNACIADKFVDYRGTIQGLANLHGLVAVVRAVLVNPIPLQHLKLAGNHLTCKGATIASALVHHRTREFKLKNGETQSTNSRLALESLDLSDNNIWEEGVMALASAVKKGGALVRLNLSGNVCRDQGAEALVDALLNPTGVCLLSVLVIRHNFIFDSGAIKLIKCLGIGKSSLRELDLRENKIGLRTKLVASRAILQSSGGTNAPTNSTQLLATNISVLIASSNIHNIPAQPSSPLHTSNKNSRNNEITKHYNNHNDCNSNNDKNNSNIYSNNNKKNNNYNNNSNSNNNNDSESNILNHIDSVASPHDMLSTDSGDEDIDTVFACLTSERLRNVKLSLDQTRAKASIASSSSLSPNTNEIGSAAKTNGDQTNNKDQINLDLAAELNVELSKLNVELQRLREANDKMEAQVRAVQLEAEAAENEKQKCQKERAEMVRKVVTMREEIAEDRLRVVSLKDIHSRLEARKAASQNQLLKVTSDLLSVRQDHSIESATTSQVEEQWQRLRDHKASLQIDIDDLFSQAQRAEQKTLEAKNELARLQEQLNDMQERLRHANKHVSHLKHVQEATAEELDNASNECQVKSTELESVQKQVTYMSDQVLNVCTQLEIAEGDKDQTILSLRRQLQQSFANVQLVSKDRDAHAERLEVEQAKWKNIQKFQEEQKDIDHKKTICIDNQMNKKEDRQVTQPAVVARKSALVKVIAHKPSNVFQSANGGNLEIDDITQLELEGLIIDYQVPDKHDDTKDTNSSQANEAKPTNKTNKTKISKTKSTPPANELEHETLSQPSEPSPMTPARRLSIHMDVDNLPELPSEQSPTYDAHKSSPVVSPDSHSGGTGFGTGNRFNQSSLNQQSTGSFSAFSPARRLPAETTSDGEIEQKNVDDDILSNPSNFGGGNGSIGESRSNHDVDQPDKLPSSGESRPGSATSDMYGSDASPATTATSLSHSRNSRRLHRSTGSRDSRTSANFEPGVEQELDDNFVDENSYEDDSIEHDEESYSHGSTLTPSGSETEQFEDDYDEGEVQDGGFKEELETSGDGLLNTTEIEEYDSTNDISNRENEEEEEEDDDDDDVHKVKDDKQDINGNLAEVNDVEQIDERKETEAVLDEEKIELARKARYLKCLWEGDVFARRQVGNFRWHHPIYVWLSKDLAAFNMVKGEKKSDEYSSVEFSDFTRVSLLDTAGNNNNNSTVSLHVNNNHDASTTSLADGSDKKVNKGKAKSGGMFGALRKRVKSVKNIVTKSDFGDVSESKKSRIICLFMGDESVLTALQLMAASEERAKLWVSAIQMLQQQGEPKEHRNDGHMSSGGNLNVAAKAAVTTKLDATAEEKKHEDEDSKEKKKNSNNDIGVQLGRPTLKKKANMEEESVWLGSDAFDCEPNELSDIAKRQIVTGLELAVQKSRDDANATYRSMREGVAKSMDASFEGKLWRRWFRNEINMLLDLNSAEVPPAVPAVEQMKSLGKIANGRSSNDVSEPVSSNRRPQKEHVEHPQADDCHRNEHVGTNRKLDGDQRYAFDGRREQSDEVAVDDESLKVEELSRSSSNSGEQHTSASLFASPTRRSRGSDLRKQEQHKGKTDERDVVSRKPLTNNHTPESAPSLTKRVSASTITVRSRSRGNASLAPLEHERERNSRQDQQYNEQYTEQQYDEQPYHEQQHDEQPYHEQQYDNEDGGYGYDRQNEEYDHEGDSRNEYEHASRGNEQHRGEGYHNIESGRYDRNRSTNYSHADNHDNSNGGGENRSGDQYNRPSGRTSRYDEQQQYYSNDVDRNDGGFTQHQNDFQTGNSRFVNGGQYTHHDGYEQQSDNHQHGQQDCNEHDTRYAGYDNSGGNRGQESNYRDTEEDRDGYRDDHRWRNSSNSNENENGYYSRHQYQTHEYQEQQQRYDGQSRYDNDRYTYSHNYEGDVPPRPPA